MFSFGQEDWLLLALVLLPGPVVFELMHVGLSEDKKVRLVDNPSQRYLLRSWVLLLSLVPRGSWNTIGRWDSTTMLDFAVRAARRRPIFR